MNTLHIVLNVFLSLMLFGSFSIDWIIINFYAILNYPERGTLSFEISIMFALLDVVTVAPVEQKSNIVSVLFFNFRKERK